MELYRHPAFKSATTEVTLCPLGDIQWAGDEEDLAWDHLTTHVQRCLAAPTPLFVGMGDYIDFASPSNRARLLEARLYDNAKRVIADATRGLVEDIYGRLLKPTVGKWLGLVQGHHHHPARLKDDVLLDSDEYLAKLLKAPYLDEFGFIRLEWPGGHTFHIVVFHGKGSSVFPWGPLNQLWRLVPNFQADLLLMGHQCLPTRARILTAEGFKRHDEVMVGDSVLAYDTAAGVCKWTPLESVTTYASAPLVIARSKSFKIEMTPGHRMVFRGMNGEERIASFEEAKGYERVVTHAIAEAGESSLSVRDAAILGWLVTDGSMAWKAGYPNFQIGQKKAPTLSILADILGEDATRHERKNGMTYFYLRAPLAYRLHTILPDKNALPALIPRLSRAARQAMLRAMIQAEGDGVRTFSQKAGPVWDAFLMLTVLEGLRCGLRKSQPSGFKPGAITYRARILSSHAGPPTFGYMSIVPTEPGDVWCPTTQYGTWVAELDGSVFITGNTKKAVAETDRLVFPETGEAVRHTTVKIVGTGGWTKGYIAGRKTYVSAGALSPVALGQPIIHLRPTLRNGQWDAGMTVEL